MIVYSNAVMSDDAYAEGLGLSNIMVILLVSSVFRFLIHVGGVFIREDVILWNRLVSRMIFPNVATIIIWFICLQPPKLMMNALSAMNFVTGGNSTLPNWDGTYLIPDTDFYLMTAAMIV